MRTTGGQKFRAHLWAYAHLIHTFLIVYACVLMGLMISLEYLVKYNNYYYVYHQELYYCVATCYKNYLLCKPLDVN